MLNFSLSKTAFFSLFSLSLASCSDDSTKSQSEPTFVQFSQVDGSVFNLAKKFDQDNLVLDFNSSATPNQMEVCIHIGKTRPSNLERELLAEVKIGMIYWMQSAGLPVEKYFSTMDFKTQCDFWKPNLNTVLSIILPDLQDVSQHPETFKTYEQPAVECTSSSNGVNCSSSKTAAFARMSSLFTLGDRVKLNDPARITFNPYYEWHGLVTELAKQDKNDILQKLNLIIDGPEEDYNMYEEFIGELEALKLIDSKTPFDEKIFDLAQQAGGTSRIPYTPVSNMFSTLLHELGHTIGLGHADHATGTDISGTASGLVLQGTPFLTTEAVMAYGLRYLFLTEDDKAGATSVSNTLKLGN